MDKEIKYAPCHIWGDKDFDWAALDEASIYLETKCRRWARLGIRTKEKYGTLRMCTTCAYWSYWPIYDLVYPGRMYYRWPKWVMGWIEYPLAEVFMFLRITQLVNCYQNAVLRHFWKKAAKKWPHIAAEILVEYDWYFPKGEK